MSFLLAALIAAAGLVTGTQAQASCPVSYIPAYGQAAGGLLLGGVLNAACSTAGGQRCQRAGYWAEECRMLPSSNAFAVCDSEQRATVVDFASKLHGGAAVRLSPCDLYPYLRGRTLWLIGDSHTKQLYKALQCFLFDLWGGGQECNVSIDPDLVRQLDALPVMPGQSKCFHVAGGGRVCRVGAVLGTSLASNSKVAYNGVLNLLRDRLAQPKDIFLVQFGLWHMKEGPGGPLDFANAVRRLGVDYLINKERFPYVIFRETPMAHERDLEHNVCKPAPRGWGFDYATGKLTIEGNFRSAATAVMARGGLLNGAARNILSKFKIPVMDGYAWSVPLHKAQVTMRGVPELDCTHYCSPGLPELAVYELARLLKAGVAGIKPLPPGLRGMPWPCAPASSAY